MQPFDSGWPWVQRDLQVLYTPFPPPAPKKHQQFRGDLAGAAPVPPQPRAQPPAESRRPKPRPCPARFCKSLSSRHPRPSTHPAVIRHSRWVRGQPGTPKEDGLYGYIF